MKLTFLLVAFAWLVFSPTNASSGDSPVYHGVGRHLYRENFGRGPASPMSPASKQSMIKETCEQLSEGELLDMQVVLEICINFQHGPKDGRQEKGRLGNMKYELHPISKTKHIGDIPPNIYTCYTYKYWVLPKSTATQYKPTEMMLLTLVFLMIGI